MFSHFYRHNAYASAVLAVVTSVRPSQICVLLRQLHLRSKKQRRAIARDSSFYDAKDLHEIPMGSPPTGAPNAGGVGKNCVFRPVEKSPAQTPDCRKLAFVRHGGPRPRQCAGR